MSRGGRTIAVSVWHNPGMADDGTVTLTTGRLVLRPWQLTDVDAVLAYASDDEFRRYLAIPEPYERRDAEQFVATMLLRDWQVHPTFAITLSGEAIGDINARVDAKHHLAEIGYGISRPHWGVGYTTEAARAVVGWAFETYGLAKVMARADSRNVASWRVMEKLGMRREGLLRGHRVLREERRDEVLYGVMCEDFKST